MTALLWPLPVAILSQLLRFIFAFSYRFVITRPANEFQLLPSDLVFCAIPFNISCYKKDNTLYQGPNEIINTIPLTSEAPTDINYPPVEQKTTQSLNTLVHFLEPKTTLASDSKQAILTKNGKPLSQTHLGKTMKKNGKANMKETTKDNVSAYPKSN